MGYSSYFLHLTLYPSIFSAVAFAEICLAPDCNVILIYCEIPVGVSNFTQCPII